MPSSRASAISDVESIVNVTRPSTSDAASPASASAASVASAESCSSERPDSLENSVAPMPAIDAAPLNAAHRRDLQSGVGVHADRDRGGDVDRGHAVLLRDDVAGEAQRVVRMRRRAEPQRARQDLVCGPAQSVT